MIEFTRIDHIAMGVADPEIQAALFERLFGFRRVGTWTDERDDATGVRLALPDSSDLHFEVIGPASPNSAIQDFLDSPRGPGMHHVAFEVANIEGASKQLQALGVRASGGSDESRLIVSAGGAGEGIQLQFFSGTPHQTIKPTEAASEDGPTLGITGFDHICTAYLDRDELSRHYERMLGMKQIWRTPDGAWPDFGDCVLTIPGGQFHWEIIQPVGEESFIQRFIDTRGPAVHHVAFEVKDFDAALAACEHHGVPTFDEHDDETDGVRWRDAFIHPKHTGGLLTQIYWEAEPHTWIRSDKVRPPGYVE